MPGLPSSSEGPGVVPLKNKDFPQLNSARSARPSSSRGPPLLPRAPSRGRSRARQHQPSRQKGKGSLIPSRLPIDRGKRPISRESPSSTSPAVRPSQPKTAPTVFDEMPHGRGAQPQVRSWAAVARSATKGYSLSYIPPLSVGSKLQVSISAEMLESSDPKWEECLVVYFIGKKLPFKLVEAALKHAWGAKLVDVMANDDGFYFFHIPDRDRRKEILEGGPLTVAKVPLVLQQWHPLNLEKKKHESVPIWIRLRNLPYSLWSSIGISAISSAIGKPLYVDSQTENMRMISYARVCVEIQAGAALPDIIEVAILDEIRTVRVEYEWKPSFCPMCISFGHKCPTPQQQPTADCPPAERVDASPIAPGSTHQSPAAQPTSSAQGPGELIQVPPRKSTTRPRKSAPSSQDQSRPGLAPKPDSAQPRPLAEVPVTSSVSEDNSSSKEGIGFGSNEEELSLVHSSMPEAECPAAPRRDTRRSARSTPQVLGLPSSSFQDPPNLVTPLST